MVMPNIAHDLGEEELLRSLSSFVGVTTAAGNVGGTTLVCSALIGSNDFITGKAIILESGFSIYEDAAAMVFNPATGLITVGPAFSAQVPAGTTFYILNGISAKAFATFLPILLAAIATISVEESLIFSGTVTPAPAGPALFTISSLAGLGADKFIPGGGAGAAGYSAFIFRTHGGLATAPQGEMRAVLTYDTTTGTFTTNAFSNAVGVGDEIQIIHPRIAEILAIKTRTDNLAGLPPVAGATVANWQAAEANLIILGAHGVSNKFHGIMVGIQNLVGNITIRIYTQVNGVERRIFPIPAGMTFSVAGDAPAIPILNSTLGCHEALRVTVQSDNAADNGASVDYDALIEAM